MKKLEVQELQKNFGGVRAVNRVSFDLSSGTRLAIIGPNGAGKTTLLNLLTGQLEPTSGRILLDGREITTLEDYERARLDITRTFQHTNIYPGLTTLQNVRLAVQQRMGITRSLLPIAWYSELTDEARTLLRRHGLEEHADTLVRNLSYGDRRHLELVVALATDSSMLFMDEPTAGMTPRETQDMIELIQRVPERITVCIVEHDMDVVFQLADQIIVLHQGEIIALDTPENVKKDSAVRDVYLGKRVDFGS